jgi:hypothetical protein
MNNVHWIDSLDNTRIMLSKVVQANDSDEKEPKCKYWSKTIANFVCPKPLNLNRIIKMATEIHMMVLSVRELAASFIPPTADNTAYPGHDML